MINVRKAYIQDDINEKDHSDITLQIFAQVEQIISIDGADVTASEGKFPRYFSWT